MIFYDDGLHSFVHKLEKPIYTIVALLSTFLAFIGSYFFNLTIEYHATYIAIISVTLLDGIFGMIAGIKVEGFKTYKAIKILRTTFVWIFILTTLLLVEEGFKGMGWITETIMAPFIIFQIISTLKNASKAGYIKSDELNNILERVDKHKDYIDNKK